TPTISSASPFPTRDQNPLLAGFGLPTAMPAQIEKSDEWQWSADFNWGSSAILQDSDRETLMVDAETRELRLTLGRSLTDRWAVQLQLPYRYTGAGSLDGFIDDWHDFFSLPEGMRPLLPQDQFRIAYERDDAMLLDMQSSREGLGDVSAAAGYQWLSSDQTHLAAWLSVKLPTGNADDLTGSGSLDATLLLAGERRFAARWSVFGQAAATWLGSGDILSDQQRSIVWSGMAGVGVNVWKGLDLKIQFDAHTAAFDDTDLDYLGDAAILTVGGAYRFTSGWQFDFGVSEDIVVDASPDVVFVIGVRKATAGD
ncbi:MAG TPA: DUF3187 family protein, partial [Povalibacter sp.]